MSYKALFLVVFRPHWRTRQLNRQPRPQGFSLKKCGLGREKLRRLHNLHYPASKISRGACDLLVSAKSFRDSVACEQALHFEWREGKRAARKRE